MDSNFVLGLIAGEGCFSSNMTKNSHYSWGVCPRLAFHLGMGEREREMIEAVQQEISVGDIKDHQEGHVRLQVQRLDDKAALIDYIEENCTPAFEKSSKFKAYDKWRDLFNDRDELIESEEGMKEFATRSCQINPDDGRRGRTAEEIHEIIEASAD